MLRRCCGGAWCVGRSRGAESVRHATALVLDQIIKMGVEHRVMRRSLHVAVRLAVRMSVALVEISTVKHEIWYRGLNKVSKVRAHYNRSAVAMELRSARRWHSVIPCRDSLGWRPVREWCPQRRHLALSGIRSSAGASTLGRRNRGSSGGVAGVERDSDGRHPEAADGEVRSFVRRRHRIQPRRGTGRRPGPRASPALAR